MKKIYTILILLFTTISSYSQDLKGKWYMINRSGLVEFSFSKDSIKSKKVYSDLKPKDRRETGKQIHEIKQLSDRILIIGKADKDSTKYSALVLINLKKDKSFQFAWNVLDTNTIDIKTLVNLNNKDKRKLFGYTLFSEKYIDTLNKFKSLDSMTLADFKNYFTTYQNKLKETEEYKNIYIIGYAALIYNFQLLTQALYENGFNPIQNSVTMDALYDKYYNDPEVQKLVEEIK